MRPDMDPIQPATVEWDGATPAAPAFGDHYYSTAGGIEESRLVFLHANRLAERFVQLGAGDAFVIGETGFGTGLNLLLAAALFLERAPAGARLHLVSAEKHPLLPNDLARALAAWPELAPLAARLQAQWPPPTCGFHRIQLDERVELTLMFGDATAMWQAQDAAVDAWFLDGFAPSRNASMWTPTLFARIAALSRPGATLGTFSAAGTVRRGLETAGFRVRREPGFGHKRHRLEATRPGEWSPRAGRRGEALVVGAGLAGCTAAHALARRGWTVRIIDADGIARGASGNRAGVVYTTPSGMATPQNRFYQSSWLRALGWLHRAGAVERGLGRLDGVEQIAVDPRKRRKQAGALTSGHWPELLLESLGDDHVLLKGGGILRPPDWCRSLLEHPSIRFERARCVEPLRPDRPVLLDGGRELHADAVVLSVAGATNALVDGPSLPIRNLRGQVTEIEATPASRSIQRAVCHAGYLMPELDGVHCIGATYDLHDLDPAPRAADDQENLRTLHQWRPEAWNALGGEAARIVGRRVGFRCGARDYLPIVGPLDGEGKVWISTAFGSRGISGTPLAADRIADALSGEPAALDRAMRDALSPARFA